MYSSDLHSDNFEQNCLQNEMQAFEELVNKYQEIKDISPLNLKKVTEVFEAIKARNNLVNNQQVTIF